jgi:hypothetical protein
MSGDHGAPANDLAVKATLCGDKRWSAGILIKIPLWAALWLKIRNAKLSDPFSDTLGLTDHTVWPRT